jgi:MFS family permease
MAAVAERPQQPIRSTIPARLDRLRWTPFHTRLVLGLGAAWVLDGLSITIASSVTSKLTQPDTLNLSTAQAASIGTLYLVGEVIGALVFGRMSDTLGRRKLFTWTLAVYLVGTGLTALTPKGSGWIFYLYATRIIAGMGIGGEYSAINSAIDEMMPARYRGRTDVWINGTYWLGAIIGTFATFLLLSTLRTSEGWRICLLVGPALAFVIIFIRRNLPESPRWLITRGREQEAEEAIRRIEEAAVGDGQHLEPVPESAAITIVPERRYGYLTLLRVAFRQYPKRAVLGATLMITQSFLYNAIFFTYALVLTKFYHVSNNAVPLYGLAFAVGNLAGPLLLGHLFDSVGRKKMISGTYLISGSMLAFSAWLFAAGTLSAGGQTFIWIVIFFFASAGASAGYLTVSEIFPIEIRAEALAVFFAIAQVFGAVGPAFYGVLIGNGSNRASLAIGYLVGGGIMIIGGVVEAMFGINAEGKSLEAIAPPLTEVGSGKRGVDEHDRYRRSGQL